VGTSSFATADWVGAFYPPGTRPEGYLPAYAQRFDTVEIDASFYGTPTPKQVENWYARTPDTFVFAAKVPQAVSHAQVTGESLAELAKFVEVMRGLGPKLGPLLFQFPYIAKGRDAEEWATGDRFRARLAALLERLPEDLRFAVEVRNDRWISPPLLDLLRAHRVALAFIDYYTMTAMPRIAARAESLTTDFAYVRFLGNHKEMDALVERKAREGGKRWDGLVQDRTAEVSAWLPALRTLAARIGRTYLFFNNHYAGHAPASIELFKSLWSREG
jgi:uncharacterized protein YecE (DUF72 family)